jgi:hypothetical protein
VEVLVDRVPIEGRELNPWPEYVAADDLVEGQTYFVVRFLDEQMLVPEMLPFVFIGVDLERGDSGILYFQDARGHAAGIRYETPSAGGDADSSEAAEFHTVDKDTPFVFTFERALDELLRCSAMRAKHGLT